MIQSLQCHQLRAYSIALTELNHDSHFFSNRTINLRNSLPDSIVTAPVLHVTCFKPRLRRVFIIGPLFSILPLSLFNFTA